MKRGLRTAAAAVISAGLVGTFALPAYAAPAAEELQFLGEPVQSLTTADAVPVLDVSALPATIDEDVIAQEEREAQAAEERERLAAEEAQAQQTAAAEQAQAAQAEVPAGAGAQGIVSAALAQLGQFQDCTALVERSLRAVGYNVGDLGTQVGEYAQYGTVVTGGGYAPGDILIWPGQHVAIFIGNGQAVHGGWNGNQTVVASAWVPSASPVVVRVG